MSMLVNQPAEVADERLIAQTLEGDHDAFAELVARHQRRVHRTALAILRDENEAETVTHETFVQAYLKLSTFEQRACFETWLTRIVINRSRDVLRKRRWLSLTSLSEDEETERLALRSDAPDAERELSSRELSAAIEHAVDALSVQQKMIFRLRHFEDRSLEEIARLLGLRAGTVRAHLFRAVHKVRQQLAGWMPGRLQTLESGDETL